MLIFFSVCFQSSADLHLSTPAGCSCEYVSHHHAHCFQRLVHKLTIAPFEHFHSVLVSKTIFLHQLQSSYLQNQVLIRVKLKKTNPQSVFVCHSYLDKV